MPSFHRFSDILGIPDPTPAIELSKADFTSQDGSAN